MSVVLIASLPRQEEVRQLVRAKRHKMVRAFAVLQEQREEGGEPVVSQANWNQLVRLVQPDLSNAHRELLWSVSDDKNQGCIGGSHTHTHTHTHIDTDHILLYPSCKVTAGGRGFSFSRLKEQFT